MLLKMKNKFTRFFSSMPIVNKITGIYTIVFSLSFLFANIIIIVLASIGLEVTARAEMEETLNSISEYIENGGNVTMQAIMGENVNPFIDVVIVDNGSGADVVRIISPRPKPPGENFDGHFILKKRAVALSENIDDKAKILTETRNVKGQTGSYTIKAFRWNARDRFYVRGLVWLFAGINVIGFIASYFAGKYISAHIIKPIKHITETARRISATDLSGRIPETGPDDELKLLSVTFNDMIDRLKISFDRQTAFVSDASHELKTPISVIQGYANLLSRWGKDDPEILHEAVDSIKNETEHMAMLIKKLLFLSKGDQKAVNANMQEVSLNEIAMEVKKEFELCYPKRIISLVEQDNVLLIGDYDLIKQLIWAFVDNSVKYSSVDSNIEICVYIKNDKSMFSVRDNGIGLNESDIPYIFDRFYRADKSRAKVVKGAGLGLSIARMIIDIHDAKVKVESEVGEGTVIEVIFNTSSPYN